MDLFELNVTKPLADELRPKKVEEIVGQEHLTKETGAIGRMIKSGKITSFILWGPPGCGKTTIARMIAEYTNLYFEQISAVFSGVADLKKAFSEARSRRLTGQGTLLFVDEIHRFNRAQQDGFLPYVEDGTIILVGATTENPSFELNSALLSRCRVLVLNQLNTEALDTLLKRAEETARKKLPLDEEARATLIAMANGDGRYLLNMVETIFNLPQDEFADGLIKSDELAGIIGRRAAIYDKDREGHYNLISALHKSLRGSDVQAGLYWMARMLEGGEDPKYIFRRLTRFAVEDVSMADPNALVQAISAWQAYERLGSPEGELALSQLVVYLATAPKSAGNYKAYKAARVAASQTNSLSPPKHILNAPTKLMEEVGYGKGYIYDHDTEDGFSGQNYFPDEMARADFYKPVERGFERDIIKRLAYWDKLRKEKNKNES